VSESLLFGIGICVFAVTIFGAVIYGRHVFGRFYDVQVAEARRYALSTAAARAEADSNSVLK
jgi:hypothetical protein